MRLHQSVVRRRAQPPIKAVRGTLLHMMRHRQYWHFGVTWKQWKLEYRYDWCDSPLWTIRVGPLWILLH